MLPASILFTHYGNPSIRGSEQCLLDLVAHIDRSRFTPKVICNQALLADAVRALDAEAHLSEDTRLSPFLAPRDQVRNLRQFAVTTGAKLIHANTTGTVPALLRVARSLRIPLLSHLHLPLSPVDRLHMLLHQVSLVVGVSHATVRGLVQEGIGADRVTVIHNGVDGARISRGNATALRPSLGIPQDAIVVGAVGSLIHRKGFDVLLAAFSQLRSRHSHVHLIIAGSGVERQALTELARSLQLDQFTHFLGERLDAGAIFRDAVDVAVSASREETFGLTLIESGFFGVPVVATDLPPHREIVKSGETGLLVPREDPTALADALATLVVDESLRDRLGRNVKALVEREFLIERYTSSFEAAYAHLLRFPSRQYGWLAATRWPRAYNGWLTGAVSKRLGIR